jgi:hypothetical protein
VPDAGHNLLVEAPSELCRITQRVLEHWHTPNQPLETRP